MMCEIFDGHLLVLSVRTIEPVALSRRPGLPECYRMLCYRVSVLKSVGYSITVSTILYCIL